jgi:DNA repair protein RecO (recombination protein O)
VLASGLEHTTSPLLRAFELMLLRDIGFLPDLSMQTMTLQPVLADKGYGLVAEGGLQAMPKLPQLVGWQWLQLQAALDGDEPLTSLLRICAEWTSEERTLLQTQLRGVLHYHCGVSSLRTRQVMMDLQAL